MKNFTSTSVLSTLLLGLSFCVIAQGQPQNSYFTKGLVSSILSQRNCAGLRLYPATDANNNSVVMIIGIDANGNELYNEASSNYQYQMFSRVSGSTVTDVALNRQQAQTACSVYTSKNSSFVSDISAASVQSLLEGESAGISVVYSSSQTANFVVSAYKNERGVKAYGKTIPGEPCPSACGEPRQYLCSPTTGR